MTIPIGGLRVLNVHIANDVRGAFAARPETLINDFFSMRTREIDLTFVDFFQRMITMQNFLAVGAVFAVGALFSWLRLPLPAPPTLTGILGAFGVFLGSVVFRFPTR